ncbi:hypothetical protein EMIHUDRAFT_242820 [Emiliania huxleyi CCMP1516]|uniref:SET domain-containing protein n=2 Tax=Emiliania huxleyi TaxID=2903 RepID=A0A0D3J815_EMIH1|nr:hypothetical protein EMIHUDRAFT_242820 [Emiliania huxleyi CCMP1516]EOD19650.1 hypothetical protein EMIHUDRAFT_242820 [Emiliania huxleyi CCMP1516]|eukprot:XP_005772079.1 hypothetical protein EMIHUDRAFT_242820 [Emiliania huxleyi CCMP1516]
MLAALALGPAAFATPASSHSCTQELASWINAHGGRVHLGAATVAGLRGLVAQRSSAVGDVLLEVPLECVLSTAGDGAPLPAEPPPWTASLPWNVQLALSALERERDEHWRPFLQSWPAESPALPLLLEPEALSAAQDDAFEADADAACFWLHEQYLEACDAAEAAGLDAPAEPAFRRALQLVWSRCLRLRAGPHGTRRLLVPMVDLANHDGVAPAALFAFSAAGRRGACVRLYAARPLEKGDEVTITYGDHPNAHFAKYYGFVPRHNPHDTVSVALPQLLELSGAAPPSGACWVETSQRVAALLRLGSAGCVLSARAVDAPRLLRDLRGSMLQLAVAGPSGAPARMRALQRPPPLYPHLEALPPGALEAWASRAASRASD